MSEPTFGRLFQYLRDRDIPYRCEIDLKITMEFCELNGIDALAMADFVKEHGASCDCEVLYKISKIFPVNMVIPVMEAC